MEANVITLANDGRPLLCPMHHQSLAPAEADAKQASHVNGAGEAVSSRAEGSTTNAGAAALSEATTHDGSDSERDT